MGRRGRIVWAVVRIIVFFLIVLCGLLIALLAFVAARGAPHAFAPSPWLAVILFLISLLLVGFGILRVRRSTRELWSVMQVGQREQVPPWLYAVVGAGLLLLTGAIVCPWVYAPPWPAKGSIEHGDYMVEPPLLSSCSPDAHRIFYRSRVVTRVAGRTTFSPHNPSRLLYTAACANNGTESGVFYFGGSGKAPVQANPLTMDEPGNWFDSFWSPDDKFVVVPAYGHSTLVNLETGQRSDYLSDVFSKKDALASSAEFRGWAPDGKKMAIVISSSFMRDDRSLLRESELVSVDPATLAGSHIATIDKGDGWSASEFAWVPNGGSYDLTPKRQFENQP